MEPRATDRTADKPVKEPLRVTLVNDYEIIVQGLQRMLEPFSDRIRIVETEVGGLPTVPTDIALFDTFGGRRYSLARVKAMTQDLSIGKVVLYTWDAPAAFRDDVARYAVDAVILKSGPQLGEFGRTIRFLVDTPSMTGQMIALDGGQHLAWQTPDILEIVE